MVDLHSHTDASDGTDTPAGIVDRALSLGLEALAITDHDTLHGYESALPYARQKGLPLICGVELSTKFRKKTVHLLAYFASGPTPEFCGWLTGQQLKRRERNEKLAARLQSLGLDVSLAEVEALGKHMAGRPHFAKILVRKGYVKTSQEAFDRYIADEGEAFVDREEVPLEDAIRRVRDSAGISVLAHPVRLGLRNAAEEEEWIAYAAALGLTGIEVQHSDHGPAERARYSDYASRYGLRISGGSDFHGDIKPDVFLGTGREHNVAVPLAWLEALLTL